MESTNNETVEVSTSTTNVTESSPDVKKLEEELTVIQEVRKELSDAYKNQVESKKTIEEMSMELGRLKSQTNDYKKTIEEMSNTLGVYKTRDVEARTLAYNKRLEQLSNNFAKLGQVKTIEEMSAMPEAVIKEFEAITNSALNAIGNTRVNVITDPSQTSNVSINSLSSSKPEVKPQPKPFSMEGICKVLQNQQHRSGIDSKRVINL